MNKTKYISMNYMRVMAFFFIIVYHFMFELEQIGSFNFHERGFLYYSNNNLHIGVIGVSMFFMISGAGLMLSSTRKWNVVDFYRRRFTKLLLPFYVVEIFTLIASFVMKPEWLAYFPSVSKKKVLLNFLGMDGYFEQFFPTFSLHVGEWFLGALIMLYAVFPLIRLCMEKNRYITMVIATVYYIVVVFGNIIPISPWSNVFVKVYDFILGMFIILEMPMLMDKKIFRVSVHIISLAVVVLGILLKTQLPTPMTFNNLIYALMLFVWSFSVEAMLSKESFFDRVVDQICRISYEVFLVHHIIIYYIGDSLGGRLIGLKQMGALFITEVFIMIAMALLVQAVVRKSNEVLFHAVKSKGWSPWKQKT